VEASKKEEGGKKKSRPTILLEVVNILTSITEGRLLRGKKGIIFHEKGFLNRREEKVEACYIRGMKGKKDPLKPKREGSHLLREKSHLLLVGRAALFSATTD